MRGKADFKMNSSFSLLSIYLFLTWNTQDTHFHGFSGANHKIQQDPSTIGLHLYIMQARGVQPVHYCTKKKNNKTLDLDTYSGGKNESGRTDHFC